MKQHAMKNILVMLIAATALSACGEQQFAVEAESKNFAQSVTYNKEVDVLWVVDTSGSMAARQNALADQVPDFIASLNATGLDYNIAVTTMDMSGSGQRGKFIAQSSSPLILTKSTPNLIGLLAGRIRAGAGGSPVERGREALMTALNSAKEVNGFNAGFLRPNALLNVIFLTDEEDESDNAVNYVTQLDAIKPPLPLGDRSWIAHFMGVMPSDPSCQTAEWGFASPGTRYITLADASGGSKESICDANFQRALKNVRARILEVQTEFPLNRKPIEKTIVVYINGVKIPNDATNGWTYRASANSIRFHGTAIPKEGASIKVDFDPEGLKE